MMLEGATFYVVQESWGPGRAVKRIVTCEAGGYVGEYVVVGTEWTWADVAEFCGMAERRWLKCFCVHQGPCKGKYECDCVLIRRAR
jgi:hypothetical protein